MLKSTHLGEWVIKVYIPKSLSTSIGGIYNFPLDISEEEIKEVLKDQTVSNCIILPFFNKDKQKREPPQLNHILIVQIYQIICPSVSGHTQLNCLYLSSIFQMSTVWPYAVKLY